MSREARMQDQTEPRWSPPAEDTTRDGHAEALRRLRDCAAGAGSWAAAVSAELQRGKLLGLNAGGEAEAETRYARMSPAERRASVADLFRQWHRQGLVPGDVCDSIFTLEFERRQALSLPVPGDEVPENE
jgi:hypothetical protein